MKLTDEQIGTLIDKFVNSDSAKPWRKQRMDDWNRWREWIDAQKLPTLSDDELKARFLEYFTEGAGRHPFNAIYRDRIVRDVAEFRKAVISLLDESVPVAKRLDNVLDPGGKHHIDGFGKGLATSILMDSNPDLYPVWNNKTSMGLEALGLIPEGKRGESKGQYYERVRAAISRIRNLRPQFNYIEIDHFLHIVSAEDEGREAVRDLVEGREVVTEVSEGMDALSVGEKNMDFALESYLEEFIVENFDKIDFGAKLTLYEGDEESSGRQYQTGIGKIDLLAEDKTRNEFVVIELKKGKTSDDVVGQVLRYMGWVKKNLAKDGKVRGIIIAKERDDRLEYALSMVQHVSLLLYDVSFALRRSS